MALKANISFDIRVEEQRAHESDKVKESHGYRLQPKVVHDREFSLHSMDENTTTKIAKNKFGAIEDEASIENVNENTVCKLLQKKREKSQIKVETHT